MMRFTVLFLIAVTVCNGFVAQSTSKRVKNTSLNAQHSRRNILSIGVATVVATALPITANAAGSAPTQAELDRIKEGYNGLVYLLDNFEQETTVCRENGGECKRDANAVRKYLGLRSTTDPLFQIEKVFDKVKYMDIDPDKLDSFYEATEDYNSAMTLSEYCKRVVVKRSIALILINSCYFFIHK